MSFGEKLYNIMIVILIPVAWIIGFILLMIGLLFIHIFGYFYDLFNETKNMIKEPIDEESWNEYKPE